MALYTETKQKLENALDEFMEEYKKLPDTAEGSCGKYKHVMSELLEEFESEYEYTKQQEESWRDDAFTVNQIEAQGYRRGMQWAATRLKEEIEWLKEHEQ